MKTLLLSCLLLTNCSRDQIAPFTASSEIGTTTKAFDSEITNNTTKLFDSEISEDSEINGNEETDGQVCILKRPIITLQLNDEEHEELNLNISENCTVTSITKGLSLSLEFQCEKEKYKIETWQPNALVFTTIEINTIVNLNIFYYINSFENYRFINIRNANGPLLVFISAFSLPDKNTDFAEYYPKSDFFEPLKISEQFECEKCYKDDGNGFIIPACLCTIENSVNFELNGNIENINAYGSFSELDFYIQTANKVDIETCELGLPGESYSSWIKFLGIKN